MKAASRMPSDRTTPSAAGQATVTFPVLGELSLLWSEAGLVRLAWGHQGLDAKARTYRRLPAFLEPLRHYAHGESIDPTEVPVDLSDGTPFQREVWAALRRIPRGKVRSYAGIAADVGRPRAMRAVGAANGANPVPIVVPCHRVVSSGHRLGGYSGGLDRKRALLLLEGVRLVGDRLLPGQLELFR